MDAADLLARLHPIRLPAATVAGLAAEALAALALGLALAALVLRLVARRAPSRREAAMAALQAARALPPQARLAAQIALLRDAAPGGDWAAVLGAAQAAPLRAALYCAAPPHDLAPHDLAPPDLAQTDPAQPDPAQTERAVRRALARLRG